MPIINVSVTGQRIEKKNIVETVENTLGYLKCAFEFQTADWDGTIKTACFENPKTGGIYRQLLDENGVCEVPHEVIADAGYIKFSVIGERKGYRITAGVESFYNSGTLGKEGASEPPTPNQYEQMIALAEETKEIAESVRQDADCGMFDGESPHIGKNGNWYIGEKDTGQKAQGPCGLPGEKGDKGKSATIEIGTVTTGEPDVRANVTNIGTENAAVLNFVIPRGKTGEKGEKGEPGKDGEKGPSGQNATDEQVREAVDVYMERNPALIDTTLSKEKAAAEAKTTGKRLESLSIKNKITGSSTLTTKDSALYPIYGMTIYGKSNQIITTGSQILDVVHADISRETNGIVITINPEGSIIFQGISTQRAFVKFINKEQQIRLLPGIYTLAFQENLPAGCRVVLGHYNTDSGKYIENLAEFSAGRQKTFTVEEETGYLDGFFETSKEGVTVNVTLYPMLNRGDEEKKWEPYTGGGPSPSPEYHQEIVNSGNKYEISFLGENLYSDGDKEKLEALYTTGFVPWAGINKIYMQYMGRSDGVDSKTYISVEYYDEKFKSLGSNGNAFNVRTEWKKCSHVFNGAGAALDGSFLDLTTVKYLKISLGAYQAPYPVSLKNIVLSVKDIDFKGYQKPQKVTLISPRPLTKWDRLERRKGVWGWRYKSKKFVFGSETEVDDRYLPKIVINFTDKKDYVTSNVIFYCSHFQNVNSSNSKGSGVGITVSSYPDIQTKENFKDFLIREEQKGNPVIMYAETIQETFVPLSDEEQQALNALHTYYPTTILTNDQDCEMALEYAADTKTYIDNKIQEAVQSSIADNLLSTNRGQALSAPMGARINARITALEKEKR